MKPALRTQAGSRCSRTGAVRPHDVQQNYRGTRYATEHARIVRGCENRCALIASKIGVLEGVFTKYGKNLEEAKTAERTQFS